MDHPGGAFPLLTPSKSARPHRPACGRTRRRREHREGALARNRGRTGQASPRTPGRSGHPLGSDGRRPGRSRRRLPCHPPRGEPSFNLLRAHRRPPVRSPFPRLILRQEAIRAQPISARGLVRRHSQRGWSLSYCISCSFLEDIERVAHLSARGRIVKPEVVPLILFVTAMYVNS
jgi:hypothetical protein